MQIHNTQRDLLRIIDDPGHCTWLRKLDGRTNDARVRDNSVQSQRERRVADPAYMRTRHLDLGAVHHKLRDGRHHREQQDEQQRDPQRDDDRLRDQELAPLVEGYVWRGSSRSGSGRRSIASIRSSLSISVVGKGIRGGHNAGSGRPLDARPFGEARARWEGSVSY